MHAQVAAVRVAQRLAHELRAEVRAADAEVDDVGDPLAAVAWLANTLAPMGVTLPAGSVIMTGALHAMVPVSPGDVFRADFDRLGPITIRMAGE